MNSKYNKIVSGILKDLKAIPRKFVGANGKVDVKKLLIQVAPYLLAAYFANKIAFGYRISIGEDFWAKVMALFNDFGRCFQSETEFNANELFLLHYRSKGYYFARMRKDAPKGHSKAGFGWKGYKKQQREGGL